MSDGPSRMFDQALLSAWQAELKATHSPIIKEPCLQREPNLLPRFATYYQELRALRRRVRRRLQRQWKRSLAGVALLLALGQAPALAATINVGGTCTLVRAINAANNDTRANGRCAKGSGADKIVLPQDSTQRLTTVNNTVYGPTGLPVIRTDITIAGHNSTIRRTASAPDFRIFAVGDNGDLTLRRTTVSGGRATRVTDTSVFYGRKGGGVFNLGTLALTNSTISGNTASSSSCCTSGGGVYISGGNITLTNSTI